MAVSHVFSNAIADGTNTNIVRPIDWNSAHNQLLTITGNTAGQSTASGTNIVLAGGNNVTLSINQGANVATVSFSGPNTTQFLTTARASNDAVGLNTALTAGPLAMTVNSSGLSLNAASAAGTTSGFAGNSIGGSMTHNTAGLNLSLSHPAWITTARASNDAVGLNTALTAGPLALTVNSSGLSLNAGSAAGTSSGFGGNLISGSMTHNTAGLNLTLNHPAWLTTAAQSGHSHGNPTLALTNLTGTTASNSAGLTLSLSAAAQGLTTARASTDGIGLNTAATNVTWTANSSGLSINAAGYAGTGTTFNGANVSGSMTVNSNGVNLSLSAGAGGTINQTGPNVGISNIGNTLGTSGTVSAGNYVLAGVGGITLSQSSSGSNGTLTISCPAQNTLSHYSPPWANSGGATNSSLGQSSLYMMPFDVDQYISASRIQFFVSVSGALLASNSTGTCSAGIGYALYTRGTAGSTERLMRLTSYSAQIHSQSMSSNTAYRATHYIGLSDITSHSTSQYAQSSSNASTYLASSINGLRALNLPLNSTLTPGRYWLGVSVQTVTGNAMTNGLSVLHTAANLHPAVVAWGVNSSATNASNWRPMQGFGTYSAVSASWPSEIPLTSDSIRHGVSQTMVHFNILGYATSTNFM